MNNTQKNLLHRLSQALFGTQDTFTLPEDVLSEAKAQTVSSLLVNDYQAIAKNIRCIAAHAELTELMKGIPFVTIKGYASALYYPIPERRMMGDVDFFVAPENLQVAYDRLLDAGCSRQDSPNERHSVFRNKSIILELHSEIKGVPNGEDGIRTEFLTAEAKVRELLSDLINASVTVETQQGPIVIPDEFHHGLIMLLHVAGHMVNDGGVGLRHLCDWAVYVHRVDLEKYKEELERIGLWIFACQLTAVSSAYLGLPKKHWAGEWPKQFLECLIDDFLTAGNFGRKHGGRSGTQLIGSTSFIEFIKKRVPIVRKYPILLPFGTIYYSFHYAICVMLGKRKIVEISTIEGAKERQRLYDQFQLFNTGQRIN